jgi:hypothetical protein
VRADSGRPIGVDGEADTAYDCGKRAVDEGETMGADRTASGALIGVKMSQRWPIRALFAVLAAAVARGAEPPPARLEAPAGVAATWAQGTPLPEVVAPYIGDGLEMAVIPTPRHVSYSARLFAFDEVTVVVPDGYGHASTLRGLEAIFPGVEPAEAGSWRDGPRAGLTVAVGGLGSNPVAHKLTTSLGAAPAADIVRQAGPEGYLLFVARTAGNGVAAVLCGQTPAGDF